MKSTPKLFTLALLVIALTSLLQASIASAAPVLIKRPSITQISPQSPSLSSKVILTVRYLPHTFVSIVRLGDCKKANPMFMATGRTNERGFIRLTVFVEVGKTTNLSARPSKKAPHSQCSAPWQFTHLILRPETHVDPIR